MRFKVVSWIAAAICIGLVVAWLVAPHAILTLWGVRSANDPLAAFLGKRIAALFAGLGVTLVLARNERPSTPRTALARGFAVACTGLGLSGILEFAGGHAGVGILAAVLVEFALALGFLTARE